jgi:hypothetical protein
MTPDYLVSRFIPLLYSYNTKIDMQADETRYMDMHSIFTGVEEQDAQII